MKSPVFFTPLDHESSIQHINKKLEHLIASSYILNGIASGQHVAIKVHFGEKGNTGFIKPAHVRVISDHIVAQGANAFLADTNTLYRGERTNARDHRAIAREHGFSRETMGIDIVIPDDAVTHETVDVALNQKYLVTAKVARCFVEADTLVVVSHFKGHMLSGFGGAMKNIAMGCAMRAGKLAQHDDVAPVIYADKCIGCGACVRICPAHALTLVKKKSVLQRDACVGCGNCIAVCPTMAMFIAFGSGDLMQRKMAEYAYAVLANKKGTVYFNFAMTITQECDCWGMENPRIAPDVGIFASHDPIAIDQACFDQVNAASHRDIFKATHPDQDGLIQLRYGEELGLGTREYELIKV